MKYKLKYLLSLTIIYTCGSSFALNLKHHQKKVHYPRVHNQTHISKYHTTKHVKIAHATTKHKHLITKNKHPINHHLAISKKKHTATLVAQKHKRHLTTHNYMRGIASFYGDHDGFNGKKMADGKTYDRYDIFTAAHPTLPLGTKLKVTNLSNGRTIFVEVRDRMPKEGRVIDLSVAAANYLGMRRKGLVPVSLAKIKNEDFIQKKHYIEAQDDSFTTG